MERYLKATFAESYIDLQMNGAKPSELITLSSSLIIIASRKTGLSIDKIVNKVFAEVCDTDTIHVNEIIHLRKGDQNYGKEN